MECLTARLHVGDGMRMSGRKFKAFRKIFRGHRPLTSGDDRGRAGGTPASAGDGLCLYQILLYSTAAPCSGQTSVFARANPFTIRCPRALALAFIGVTTRSFTRYPTSRPILNRSLVLVNGTQSAFAGRGTKIASPVDSSPRIKICSRYSTGYPANVKPVVDKRWHQRISACSQQPGPLRYKRDQHDKPEGAARLRDSRRKYWRGRQAGQWKKNPT